MAGFAQANLLEKIKLENRRGNFSLAAENGWNTDSQMKMNKNLVERNANISDIHRSPPAVRLWGRRKICYLYFTVQKILA